jgi:hypothetical protein
VSASKHSRIKHEANPDRSSRWLALAVEQASGQRYLVEDFRPELPWMASLQPARESRSGAIGCQKTIYQRSIEMTVRLSIKAQIVVGLLGGLMLGSVVTWMREPEPAKVPKAPLTLAQRYPGPWIEDFHLGIARTLVYKDIRWCGYLRYKESSQHSGEYLTQCSRDGKHWRTYLVWANIREAVERDESDV